jgi:hypothetical protein
MSHAVRQITLPQTVTDSTGGVWKLSHPKSLEVGSQMFPARMLADIHLWADTPLEDAVFTCTQVDGVLAVRSLEDWFPERAGHWVIVTGLAASVYSPSRGHQREVRLQWATESCYIKEA